jgi:hypothetical protein
MTPLAARAVACPACTPACTPECMTGRLTGCPACLDHGWVHLPGELWAWPGSADRVLATIAAHAMAGLTLPGARLTGDGRLEYGGYTGIRVIDLPTGDRRRPRPPTVVALTPPSDGRTRLFDSDDLHQPLQPHDATVLAFQRGPSRRTRRVRRTRAGDGRR